MTDDLDTLATALCAATDGLPKQRPGLAPWRPAVGVPPQLTDAESVTPARMRTVLGFTSEVGWLRYARAGVLTNSIRLHHRAAALGLRRLIDPGLTRTRSTWRPAPATAWPKGVPGLRPDTPRQDFQQPL